MDLRLTHDSPSLETLHDFLSPKHTPYVGVRPLRKRHETSGSKPLSFSLVTFSPPVESFRGSYDRRVESLGLRLLPSSDPNLLSSQNPGPFSDPPVFRPPV